MLENLKLAFFCLLHNVDLVSDYLYVKTVPTYSNWIKVLLITFMLPPFIVSFWAWYSGNVTPIRAIALFFGALPIYELYNGDDNVDSLARDSAN